MTRESFEIAVAEEFDDRGEPYTFHLSDAKDRPLVVYPPTENQILLLMSIAATDRRDMTLKTMARGYNLLASMLDQESRSYVESRMERGNLSYAALFQIFDKLIELETGRPTESSADSSPSRPTTGKPSGGPARRAPSTRSKSPARRSATTSTPGSSKASAPSTVKAVRS